MPPAVNSATPPPSCPTFASVETHSPIRFPRLSARAADGPSRPLRRCCRAEAAARRELGTLIPLPLPPSTPLRPLPPPVCAQAAREGGRRVSVGGGRNAAAVVAPATRFLPPSADLRCAPICSELLQSALFFLLRGIELLVMALVLAYSMVMAVKLAPGSSCSLLLSRLHLMN